MLVYNLFIYLCPSGIKHLYISQDDYSSRAGDDDMLHIKMVKDHHEVHYIIFTYINVSHSNVGDRLDFFLVLTNV